MEAVLFVDDEINILNSLKRGLIDEEYECCFASSGKEALEIMKNKTISVIVTDMRMPEMDGLTLLKEVREKYPRTVRIVLSGYTQLQQILVTINQVDIFKFITKPWKLEEEFKVVIKQAIEYYRLQMESERLKKELESKNQAYQKILKNIEDTIASEKKSREILGMCGKQILKFNSRVIYKLREDFNCMMEVQDKVYEIFLNVDGGEEKEFYSEALIEELFKKINESIKVSKFEKKLENPQKIRVSHKIVEAILLSSILTFRNEFTLSGLYIVASNNQNNKVSISLVSPIAYKANSAGEEDIAILDLKINFLNSVIGNVASITKMSHCSAKTNGNVVITLTLDV